jgi:hypothetical protein
MEEPSMTTTVTHNGETMDTNHDPRKLVVYFHNLLNINYMEAATNIKNLAKPFGAKAYKAAIKATHPNATSEDLDKLLKLM